MAAKPGIALLPVTKQVDLIASMRAEGKSWKQIQEATGFASETINRRLKTDQAKKILQEAAEYHIQTLPLAIARHEELICSEDEGIATKAIQLRYQITSILPTHTQNVYIQSLQVNQTIALQAPAQALLNDFLQFRGMPALPAPPNEDEQPAEDEPFIDVEVDPA